MIIVRLKGGLGNQMFQYAAARALALQNKDVFKLEINELDRVSTAGDISRSFTLKEFAIQSNIATEQEVQKIKYPFGMFSKGLRFVQRRVFKQHNLSWNPAFFSQRGDLFLDGYWQSPKYFEDIRDTLLKDFSLTTPLSSAGRDFAAQITTSNSVSLHVRRADYVENPRVLKEFGVCSVEYYKKSIALIREKITDPLFFVFSDDIEWACNNLKIGSRVIFVSHQDLTEGQEIHLMSRCQHNIIANSTFSWWGAWLNQNPQKLVVAPNPWYDKVPYDAALLPQSWIQIQK